MSNPKHNPKESKKSLSKGGVAPYDKDTPTSSSIHLSKDQTMSEGTRTPYFPRIISQTYRPKSGPDSRALTDLKESLISQLKDTDPSSALEFLKSDPEGYAELLAGSDEGPSDFELKVPAPTVLPIQTASPELLKPLSKQSWYPNKDSDSYKDAHKTYFTLLKMAQQTESETLYYFMEAEVMHKNLACEKTNLIWKTINSHLPLIKRMNLLSVISDIALYLSSDPDALQAYFKCLKRLKPHLSQESDQIGSLENKLTDLISHVEVCQANTRSHQDETVKFAEQVSNVSKNLAGLQELIETVVVKVSKLDLLPSEVSVPPTAISLPTTPVSRASSPIYKLEINKPGEYTGLYTIKVAGGKITSIIPPDTNPEIQRLITFKPAIQEIFVNLDQTVLLNKISKQRKYRNLFNLPPSDERLKLLKDLVKGTYPVYNQWRKMD